MSRNTAPIELLLTGAACMPSALTLNRRWPVHDHPVKSQGLDGVPELIGIHGLLDVAVNS
jgi:hypothetical protein